MTTAFSLILDSFEKIGVYAPGESIQDADANRAFVVLKDMLDAWNEEYLSIYTLVPTIIPTVPNKQIYTIGNVLNPIPDIIQLRPARIASGPGSATASTTIGAAAATSTAPLEYPIVQFGVPVPAGVTVGSSITDITNPGAIAPGTTVSIIGANQVTMSQGAVGLGVQVGDTISFGTPPQLVNVVSTIEWQQIEGTNIALGVPDTLYYDPQYPIGNLNLAPIPAVAGQVIFQAWQPFDGFASLLQPDVTFAAGEEAAIKTNLAVMLKSYFNEAQVPPAVIADAMQTKGMLRYTNITSRAILWRLRPPVPAGQPRAG